VARNTRRAVRDPEGIPPVPGQKTVDGEVTDRDDGPEVSPRRGRPKKVRIQVEVDADVIAALATAPFDLVTALVETFTPYKMVWPDKQYDQLGPTLKAWLATKEVQLTPGWALLALYLETLGSGGLALVAQVKAAEAQRAEAEAQAKAEAERKAKETAPPPSAPPPANIVRFDKGGPRETAGDERGPGAAAPPS
jgi:hypothetical protein